MHSKKLAGREKKPFAYNWFQLQKGSDVMSAKEMFPKTKNSVAGSNGEVQWREGRCQSHFKEAQLNSEVIFNLRQS